MKKANVTILGATGAVGREMLKVLEERNFPIGELRCLASARSVGKRLPFAGGGLSVDEATDAAFAGADIVLGAAENDIARRFAPAIKVHGAVFIDNSSAFRLEPEVPLVVPEINPQDALHHGGIIANPNCSTIITVVAVAGLCRLSPILSMNAATYQAVSSAGAGGPIELEQEVDALYRGEPVQPHVFPYQIAYNLIPKIGSPTANGYTSEEMKLQNEGRKILHLPEMKVSCTCVRVPVIRSHSIAVTARFARPISVEEAKGSGCHGCGLPVRSMIFPITSTPCRWIPAIRTLSMSGGSVPTSPIPTGFACGAAATRSARALPLTQSRSPSCCFDF